MSALTKNGFEKPVNRIAARLLWKSPWWAKLKEPVQKALIYTEEEKSVKDWIDTTKGPPTKEGGLGHCQIDDKRGLWFYFSDGDIGTVIGYADERVKSAHRSGKMGQMKPPWWIGEGWDPFRNQKRFERMHYWWVSKNKEIVRVSGYAINKLSRLSGTYRKSHREIYQEEHRQP